MFATILVPLDGSATAETVLPTVQMFGQLFSAEITLLQVIDPVVEPATMNDMARMVMTALRTVEPSASETAPALEELQEQAVDRAHTYLVSIAQQLQHHGLTVHTTTVVGSAAAAIVATGGSFALIAMATHGRGGVGRWVYGSVAEKVLQTASVPVLLVRATGEQPAAVGRPHRLLVPLDGSPLAEQALPIATAIAQRSGAAITLLESVFWASGVVGADPYGYGVDLNMPAMLEQAETDARDYLVRVSEPLRAAGVTTNLLVRSDPAADAILAAAEPSAADLVIMSTHGRSGLGGWVMGSVANRVLQNARLPILLIRSTESTAGR